MVDEVVMSLDVYLDLEKCPTCGRGGNLYSANITHNLNKMADVAGIYKVLWRPDENKITHARQLIKPLRRGIKDMKERPEEYRKYDAENGWGTYDDFLPWLEKYLEACESHPNAKVSVSR